MLKNNLKNFLDWTEMKRVKIKIKASIKRKQKEKY